MSSDGGPQGPTQNADNPTIEPGSWDATIKDIIERHADAWERLAEVGDGPVIPVALCEAQHIYLRPNRLYRFYEADDCAKCRELASHYDDESP